MSRDVADKVLPIHIGEYRLPQSAGLFKVHCDAQSDRYKGNGKIELTLCDLAQIYIRVTQPLLVLEHLCLVRARLILKRRDRARVVGSEPLVVVIRRTISMEIGDRNDGFVDRELLVIHAETVAVSVRVREQTGLQDWIRRRLDTRNKVRRREGRLLDLCEVILGVLVEDKLSELAEREVLVGPDLGQVKDVVTEFLSLLRRHSLLRYDVMVSKPMNGSIVMKRLRCRPSSSGIGHSRYPRRGSGFRGQDSSRQVLQLACCPRP